MFWLWAGLRQRASSGKVDLSQPNYMAQLEQRVEVESRKLEGAIYPLCLCELYCM